MMIEVRIVIAFGGSMDWLGHEEDCWSAGNIDYVHIYIYITAPILYTYIKVCI